MTKNLKKQAIILSFPDIDGKINKDNVSNYCQDNNIEIIEFINFKTYCDIDSYSKLLNAVKKYYNNETSKGKQLICIIKAHTQFNNSHIITLCLLTSLAITEKIKIYYFQSYQVPDEQILFLEDNVEYLLPLAICYLQELIDLKKND